MASGTAGSRAPEPGVSAAAHPSLASEYEPLFGAGDEGDDPADAEALETVRRQFSLASRPFLSSPIVWLAWAVVLPAAALATGPVGGRFGPSGILLLWSLAILAGGAVEMLAIRRRRGTGRRSPLATWALRVQGNLSFVGLVLSAALLWAGASGELPGLWLLLLGHSFYTLGGLSFRPMRSAGVIFQAGGLVALWPGVAALPAFAAAAGAGCLWLAWGIWRR